MKEDIRLRLGYYFVPIIDKDAPLTIEQRQLEAGSTTYKNCLAGSLAFLCRAVEAVALEDGFRVDDAAADREPTMNFSP
jgi:hypothetical protein